MLSASAGDPLGPLFRIVTLRGARRAEACGFRWSGTDLDAGHLTVERPILLVGVNVVEGKPKSQAGARKIWLDATETGPCQPPLHDDRGRGPLRRTRKSGARRLGMRTRP
jgi:hypothetical protein